MQVEVIFHQFVNFLHSYVAFLIVFLVDGDLHVGDGGDGDKGDVHELPPTGIPT